MKMNEYQALARRKSNTNGPEQASYDKLLNGCMGLNGEAGECINLLKKHLFRGHELDRKKLAEELGDVLWYVTELATEAGYTLADIAQNNIAKLRRRYPEGFDPERSVRREC